MPRTLSSDIHLLGDALGEVLRAHAGEAVFAHEERMRACAKRARDAGSDEAAAAARAELAEVAASLTPVEAIEVVRAFTLYFQLVNQAEDVHRVRELRRRQIEAGSSLGVAESLHAIVAELAARGVGRQQALEALEDVSLEFVFTAHPTEARRRTTERLLADVRGVLEDLDRREMTPTDRIRADRRLRAGIEALWEHAAERPARPEVLEEVKAGLWYLRNVLLDAVPRTIRRLRHAIATTWEPLDADDVPSPVRFGSWMGSDRDGNPFVDVGVTERTLELQRFIVLDRYAADLDALVDPLAAASHRLPDRPDLDEALRRAEAAVPEIAPQALRRNPHEPLRRLLTFMRERVVRARTFSAGAYARPEELLADLRVIRRALVAAGARALPEHDLLDLIERVRCFGFTLCALDVREDSRVHRQVVAELLGEPDYPSWGDAARIASLARLRLPARGGQLSELARRSLDLFDAIGRLQARFGAEAIDTYIVSMTEGPADVLEVLRLADLHRVEVDVVPLLETPEALASAASLAQALLGSPDYRRHLERRGQVQELLVGYSDSMKQGGMLASRLRVQEAQRAFAAACRAEGVTLRVFHGRGGSVSRGGGPTHRAVRALPRDAFSGQIKITEQGETRAFHFANPDIAARYLEQTLGASLLARCEARAFDPSAPQPGWQELRRLADRSLLAYRDLVADEGLVPYFEAATPLALIGQLNIASRPAKRRGARPGFEDLRAIPWVFAWSQSRHVVTGWYGVGSALEATAQEPDGLERLVALYRESAFFQDLLDNVQMTLAKSDLPIAARYATLVEDPEVRDRIYGRVRDELERTRAWLLRITGAAELLDDDPVTQRSIRLRNPYVDPLSYLQVEALRRSRAGEPGWEEVARVAVQGIAAGLRNTG